MSRSLRMMASAAILVTDTTPARIAQEKGPHHPKHKNGRFTNPWPSFWQHSKAPSNPFNTIVRMREVYSEMENIKDVPKDQLAQVRKPDWGVKPGDDKAEWARDLKATWLGHACFLVEFPSTGQERGMRVLFDPVFSHRCSPFSFAGPARYTPPPLPLNELPAVDVVVLSHNHFDHTDAATIKHINSTQAKGSVVFFTTLGCAKWFESCGVSKDQIQELDWWHEREVTITVGEKQDRLRLISTPCQHFSGRTGFDAFKTLWSSWAVQHKPADGSEGASIWFGGDTGYSTLPFGCPPEEIAKHPGCPAFKEIGEQLGPFTLGLVPIGAYSKGNRFAAMHANPEQAVEIHKDVRAKRSLGIHWGTWQLSSEPITEPPKRFIAAGRAAGLAEGEVGVTDIGETTRIRIN